MYFHRKPARALTATLSIVMAASLGVVSTSNATGTMGKEDLSGPWAITFIGDTGCGSSTMLATGTLDNNGRATVTLHGHSSGCGNSTSTEVFQIETLSANGSGTAGLSCNNNNGCGWTFRIQVSPDRATFNLVDITDVGNNRLMGFAVHQ
jgi:hypothetical protein